MIGATVGHYEIPETLGEGGMGVVYRARDVLLNRAAALKLLPSDSAGADDKRRRLVQEAQSASALNHPSIVTIYEVGQAGGHDFIAMELVQNTRSAAWHSPTPGVRRSLRRTQILLRRRYRRETAIRHHFKYRGGLLCCLMS